jgi:hypothetical protein
MFSQLRQMSRVQLVETQGQIPEPMAATNSKDCSRHCQRSQQTLMSQLDNFVN